MSWKPRGSSMNTSPFTAAYPATISATTTPASTTFATIRVTTPARCPWYGRASRGTGETPSPSLMNVSSPQGQVATGRPASSGRA